MRTYSASRTIKASPELVWAILTDAAHYPKWEPNTLRIEGRIAEGAQIKVFTKAKPNRAFPVRVTELDPLRRMVWTGGLPLGLFKGERTFNLTPGPDDTTEFTTQEVFSGPLLPLIGRSLPDLQPAFERFAEALKRKAERKASR